MYPDFNSFVELNDYGGHISITNTLFNNINTCGSIFRNKRYLWSDTSLDKSTFAALYKYRANNYQYDLITKKYTSGIGTPSSVFSSCSLTNHLGTACYSLTILTSTF